MGCKTDFHLGAGVSLDGKKILVVGAHGSLEATLQCLFQRKGSMTMSSQWKTPQLQSKVSIRPVRNITLNAGIGKAEGLGMYRLRI